MSTGAKTISTKDQSKAEVERAIFELFLKAKGWPCDVSLFESRNPPEPDILYRSPDEKVAFELLELCDSPLAEARSKLAIGDESASYVRPSDPTEKLVKLKLAKRYNSDFPIELLCYSNGRIGTPDDIVVHRMTAVVKYSRSVKFRRVWYFGRKSVYAIYEKLDL